MDIHKLENEFVNGYCDSGRVLYVSIYDTEGKTDDVTNIGHQHME